MGRGVPYPADGRVPSLILDQDGGTLGFKTGWDAPLQDWTGWGKPTPLPPSKAGCYVAGGMPLAFTQEDFLVMNKVTRCKQDPV